MRQVADLMIPSEVKFILTSCVYLFIAVKLNIQIPHNREENGDGRGAKNNLDIPVGLRSVLIGRHDEFRQGILLGHDLIHTDGSSVFGVHCRSLGFSFTTTGIYL